MIFEDDKMDFAQLQYMLQAHDPSQWLVRLELDCPDYESAGFYGFLAPKVRIHVKDLTKFTEAYISWSRESEEVRKYFRGNNV